MKKLETKFTEIENETKEFTNGNHKTQFYAKYI